MHNDALGKVMEIGDIAIRISQYLVSAEPVVIVGFTKERVKINDGAVVDSSCLVVISAQLYANGGDIWTHSLHAKYSEQIAQGLKRLSKQKS
ncbi:hypothetical protein VPHD479_0335 [Vibrio phage D479]